MRLILSVPEPSSRLWRRLEKISWWVLPPGALLVLAGIAWHLAGGSRYPVQKVLIVGLLLIWGSNVLAGMARWNARLVFLFFHGSMALFILGQPLAALLGGSILKRPVTREGANEAIVAAAFSLLAVRLGLHLVERWLSRRRSRNVLAVGDDPAEGRTAVPRAGIPRPVNKQAWSVLLLVALVCMAADIAGGIDYLLYVKANSYSAYYVDKTSRLPFVVQLLGMMSPYVIAAAMAFFPRGRAWNFLLLGYFATTLPYLAMGQRGALIRALMFMLAMLVARWYATGTRVARMKLVTAVLSVLMVPVLVYGMSYIGATRVTTATQKAEKEKQEQEGEENATEEEAKNEAPIAPSTAFAAAFESQSVSFSVVARGIAIENRFPDDKVYTVGPLTDYVLYGNPGRKIFGNEPLGGQSERRATVGSGFDHAFSYYFYGQDYLDGLGSGSSYVAENYVDGGIPLVVVFSTLLGGLLSLLSIGFGRRLWVNTLLIIIMQGIITLPRDAATGFLLFLVTVPFWLVALGVWMLTTGWMQRFLARYLPWTGVAELDQAWPDPATVTRHPEELDGHHAAGIEPQPTRG